MAHTPNTTLNSTLETSVSHNPQHNYGTISNPYHQSNITVPKHINTLETEDYENTEIVAGAGLGSGSASGTAAPSRRSVLISVPEQDDDNISIASKSSYSSYSSSASSTSSPSSPRNHCDCSSSNHCCKLSNIDEELEPSARQLFWTYVFLSPILLSILAAFAGLLLLLTWSNNESITHWDRFGYGMIGWSISFVSRTPIYSMFEKILHLDPYLCEVSTLLSAGILEEIVRLGIIIALGIGKDFGSLYWLGLGWAGVETLYYIGQSIGYSLWLSEDDYRAVASISSTISPTGYTANYRTLENNTKDNEEEDLSDLQDGFVPPRQIRHLLGIDRPWWSLMGRTSSMMVHLGLCCWLGYYGWRLLVPAALVHGSLYIIWGAILPEKHWSVPATSYGTLMAAMAIFLIGLALYGQIV
ncbi:hypothetical protein BGZ76_003729 [Entomortierella beljakovae]|nr:hypothetical protein BGZ76_003729 [Entomortierella beljakovae]